MDSWTRYINYLIEWANDHKEVEYKGMSPACFDEWCDNDDEWYEVTKKGE